jgi:CHASE3 domain sensor protein
MGRRLRLPIRIAIVVAVGAAAVAVGVALLLGNTVELRDNAGATIQTNRYLIAVSSVERLVVDAETGLRGYVITGRRLFLQPLSAAVMRFPAAAAALEQAAEREHAFTDQPGGRSAATSPTPAIRRSRCAS